ncbi:hypothetical protein LOC71_02605 [Rhodopirellula sp. JC740]|uniref:Uncharacterized protein n=1 Tax=Rhodopirellula halodulae TaxID=2894198 RepID=A0ABS8NC81_9BACT|nr:hypothetical protein [Rhodopirellula sp. JC740]MCC9641148.1 hypothetical protein [Rhodopirellula sp. JC740]
MRAHGAVVEARYTFQSHLSPPPGDAERYPTDMNVYRLYPEYTANGEHYAHWVDDGVQLMDTPQSKIGPVLEQWPNDLIFDLVRDGADCDVYMNPNGLCFTQHAVDSLSPICDGHAEWLPILLADSDPLYLFHPTETVPLGSSARFRSHNPGDNIIEVYEYHFDNPCELPCCFKIPQPDTSAAGKGGFAFTGDYVTDKLYTEMGRFRGVDFARVFPSPQNGG